VIIKDNFQEIWERVNRALARSGRGGEKIKVVAVTKNVEVSRIEEAIGYGHTLFGENRVQEAKKKISCFTESDISWHLIGHLQRNKVKAALSLFSMIHSLHSIALAREISKRACLEKREIDLLLQVNASGEETKFGVKPSEVEGLLEEAEGLANIRIKGLMTIAPFTDDVALIRKTFRTLRELFEKVREMRLSNSEMSFLSMGMTGDFEIAIEEGSNMLRIGTALFGSME
jgi:pyridoxal phosphate enzyme (YggS family)